MADQLTQLKDMTVVSADTADIDAFGALQPHDATTNPTFINAATSDPKYKHLLEEAVKYAKGKATGAEAVELALDRMSVNLGSEIAKKVPGFVSTEVAGTWQGILAARELEKEGIKTNVTLVFSLAQAVFAAQSGCTLISPFVGRILDWHKKAKGVSEFAPEEDPGVLSVRAIHAYYKAHKYNTIVMGASFRNLDEIKQLAGVDRLTIAPKLLASLQECTDPLPRMLDPATVRAEELPGDLGDIDEPKFYWLHNEDACASEKLAEGIRAFAADTDKLEAYITGLDLWKAT